MKILIIGGGLAGCALAYVLKRRGAEPVILEAGETLASGASGNRIGLYNPRFSAAMTPQARFYSDAYFTALETFTALDGIDWDPCGTLHLITDEKKARRFPKTFESWSWPEEEMRLVGAEEASAIAGVGIERDALYLPRSGSVCPEKLCRAYARGIETHTGTRIETTGQAREEYGADAVVLACGMGALRFPEAAYLPLRPVRGQVTLVRAAAATETLNCNLCYGGYISRSIDGVQAIGATFQPWLDHSDIVAQDDRDNIEKLRQAVPSMKDVPLDVIGNRAAVRCATKDHFPVIGVLGDGVYISAGHGSHGILSALQGAHVLAGMILGGGNSVSPDVAEALSPGRF